MVLSVESRECLLVAESCVVPDHEVQMGQREEGRALQVGEIDVQSCGVWRLPEAFRQWGVVWNYWIRRLHTEKVVVTRLGRSLKPL